MNNISSDHQQLSINAQNLGFPLAEYLTTRKLRSLVHEITGASLTAREIEQQGKSGQFEIPWQRGTLIVLPSTQLSSNRLLRWDLYCFPICLYKAA
jgi:hypothetical protein